MCPKKLQIRLNGFTLLELIISMLIAAIIISLVFSIFSYINKCWILFHSKQEKINKILLFKKALDADIEAASTIIAVDQNTFYLAKSDTTEYFFGRVVIRKCSASVDTFEISTSNLRIRYVYVLNGSRVARQLSFDITGPEFIKDVTFSKNYTSSDLVSVFNK